MSGNTPHTKFSNLALHSQNRDSSPENSGGLPLPCWSTRMMIGISLLVLKNALTAPMILPTDAPIGAKLDFLLYHLLLLLKLMTLLTLLQLLLQLDIQLMGCRQ